MKTNIHPPALQNVRITDPLFGHYASRVAEHSPVYQWEALNDRVEGVEKSRCIENLRIVVGSFPARGAASSSAIRTPTNGWRPSPTV